MADLLFLWLFSYWFFPIKYSHGFGKVNLKTDLFPFPTQNGVILE